MPSGTLPTPPQRGQLALTPLKLTLTEFSTIKAEWNTNPQVWQKAGMLGMVGTLTPNVLSITALCCASWAVRPNLQE